MNTVCACNTSGGIIEMHVDTARVRELASHISATSTTLGELRTFDNCPSVRDSLSGSAIAPAVLTLSLLAHSAMQQIAGRLFDSEDRLIATADIYEVTDDDFVADLSVDGTALW